MELLGQPVMLPYPHCVVRCQPRVFIRARVSRLEALLVLEFLLPAVNRALIRLKVPFFLGKEVLALVIVCLHQTARHGPQLKSILFIISIHVAAVMEVCDLVLLLCITKRTALLRSRQ